VKKRYIAIGLLASSLAAFGQRQDSTYRKKKLSTADVQIIMSYYTQDNAHSAVTGGIGTEDLQVYATQFSVDYQSDSANTFHVDGGLDIISSASTDNIDYVQSSASKTDVRTHLNTGYSRRIRRNGITAGANTGFSIESDYSSLNTGLFFSKINASQSREISISLQMFFDDLRWGRLHDGKPEKLIYPVELRSIEWFDHYRRSSYNLDLGFYRVINRRMAIGVYPGLAYQSGLLSTPFHRVYFTDKSKRVENLPGDRFKVPIGVQLNTFLGGRWILRTYYRFYWDNFGIFSNTINLEAAYKVSSKFTVTPFIRIYGQTSGDDFEKYGAHDATEEFYTSDYDLSKFESFKPGLSIRLAPHSGRGRTTFNAIELRYAFYRRSDGMEAHTATLFINYTKVTQKSPRNISKKP